MDEEVKFELGQDEVDEFNTDDNYGNDNLDDQDNEGGEEGSGNHTANGNGGAGDGNEESKPAVNNIKSDGSSQKTKDEDKRKLFVGGLSWDTKEKDLKEYFSKFGEVEGLTYKTDALTGRPRGFAFIIFTDVSTVEAVLAVGEHVINGKKVDPKRAKARPGKIFVGGLIPEITNDDVRNYFSAFGNVIDMEVPIDKATNQRKSYCFVTFDDVHVAQELIKTPKQTICSREVDVKQAQPQQRSAWAGGQQGGGMGGRGGGAMGGRGGGMRGRGRGAAWGGGFNYGGPPADYYGGYGDYGYGGGYGGYGYDAYGGAYGYEGFSYDYPPGPGSLPRGGGRGFMGKARGAPRGSARHAPY